MASRTTIITLKLSFLLSFLLLVSVLSVRVRGSIPPTCKRIECPTHDVIEVGHGYEIRHYHNSTLWMSTSPIQNISLVQATRTGFRRLFDYIQGKNNYKQKIEMTAPVITEVSPGDGPFCESSFVVSFFVPKENQANPPPAKGLHVQRWNSVYVAARQFGGYVNDSNVGVEAAALRARIAGTSWSRAIDKSHKDGRASVYTVAQYNDPLEYDHRVNEIWFLFDMESERHAM
ncbi:heme-binding protein 2 [Cajanus cajan]|uniref:Heme-binding protein 2 n=1 Tax=Cajanus cajan TaxID=3821 RepID=A0A151S2A7_CAJCA|nr:heme-binding protein 2 [Cajanus cajan]KYP48898.1 Heme-binding protein 2 [Cajanus cajan]